MPLTRYQTRNEYSLADPELYRAATKDDPEALLEGVAMAGLVGVLRQLGDLAEFAAEIFHGLHEEVMGTAARGHVLMLRVQQLETEVPSIERAFLSRTSHSLFLFNAGVEWHPHLRMDQNMITREDLPRCVMDSYEECRGPPRLFLLDKFDVAGAGACSKRYSDPSFFKTQFASSETMGADIQREKKARKVKKKGSRWRKGENPEVFSTSHAKLHQLLSEERHSDNNVLVHHVKLKKRQINGFPLESTTGKSYMERFLEAHSPESEVFYENTLVLPHLNTKSNNTSELGIEIREIGTASPANKLLQGERGLDSSAAIQETALEQPMYDLHDNVISKGILETMPEPIRNIEVEKVPYSFHKMEDQKELMIDVESNKDAIVDGYQSDDITSEVDNYMDALATIESEMETDTETRPNNKRGFFNTKRLGMYSDTSEELQKHEAHFSESPSVGNSTESDDDNVSTSTISHSSPGANLNEIQLQRPDFVGYPSTYMRFSREAPFSNTEEETENIGGDIPSTTSLSDSASLMKDDPLAVEFVKSQQVEIMDGLTCHEVSSDALLHQSDISSLVVEGKYDGNTVEAVHPTKCAEDPCNENMSRNHDSPHSVTLPTEEQPSCLEGQDLEVCSSSKRPECLPATTSSDDLDDFKSDGTLESDIGIQTTGENPEFFTSAFDIQKRGVSAEQDLSEMTEELPPQSNLGVDSWSSGVKILNKNLELSSNKPAGGVNEEPVVDVVQFNSYGSVGKAAVASLEFASIYSAPHSPKPALMTDCHLQVDNLAGTVHADSDSGSIMCRKLIGSWNRINVEDDMETGSLHAEAGGEDTVVCRHLIGSPSRDHVKLEDEYPSSTGNISGLENEVHSKLDNLVSGAACTDDADTAESLKLIGSPSGTRIKLQEECLSDAGSEHCIVETIQACNPKLIIGEDAQKERIQLPAFSSDLNVEVYNSESHAPSSSELPYGVHDAVPVERAQNHLHLRDITGASTSSMERGHKLQLAHGNQPSEDAENSVFTSLSHQELSITSEQGLVLEACPLPSNLLDEQTESFEGKDQNGFPTVPSETSRIQKIEHVKHRDLDGSSGAPMSSIFPSFGLFGTTHEQPLKPQPSGLTLDFPSQGPNGAQDDSDALSLPPLPPLGWRVGKLQDSFPTSEGEMVQPSLDPWRVGKLQHSSLTSEGEMLQPSLNPFLPLGFTPLGEEIVQPLQPFLPLNSTGVVKHQYGAKVSGGDMVHPDPNRVSSHLPAMVDDANNRQGSQTLEIEEAQIPNPFLPLPTTEDDKHDHYLHTLREEKAKPSLNSFAPPPATEEVRSASDTSQGESGDLQNLSVLELNIKDGMLQPPIIKDEEPLDSFASPTIKDEEPLDSFASPTIKDEQPLNAVASSTIKDEQPLNALAPPAMKEEEPSRSSLTSEGEISSNASTSLPDAEVGVPNGKPPRKLPRPRDPLIEAVASHDKSTMRKVTERIRPQMVQRLDERDSLLEQIRTKSFSLKPTARPMVTSRSMIQGPRTNLKVAAILEKANAIRQATAGSDEDDDGDSWSDC